MLVESCAKWPPEPGYRAMEPGNAASTDIMAEVRRLKRKLRREKENSCQSYSFAKYKAKEQMHCWTSCC